MGLCYHIQGVTCPNCSGSAIGASGLESQKAYTNLGLQTAYGRPSPDTVISDLRWLIKAQIDKENYRVARELTEALETISSWRSVL